MSPALLIVAITVAIAVVYVIRRAHALASGSAGCSGDCTSCGGECSNGWDRILHPQGDLQKHRK